MKKIYMAHAINYPDFKETLYHPLKTIAGFQFMFPHENDEIRSSKEIIKDCDLFIADVSFQKLGTGMEIGWADAFEKPILFLYKKGSHLSRSLKIVTEHFIEYETIETSLKEIEKKIAEMTGKTYFV